MKRIMRYVLASALLLSLASCDLFRKGASTEETAKGAPYELILVATNQVWEGELGDTLRSILTAPVYMLNQREPLFDVMRVMPTGFGKLLREHRNVLRVEVGPDHPETEFLVQYDLYSKPQIVLLLQGPDQRSVTEYISQYRSEMVQVLSYAERDRAVAFGNRYPEKVVKAEIEKIFGVEMNVPKGYRIRSVGEDFLWASYEYPTASQGFFIYSYPYTGSDELTPASLRAARAKFAAMIPGPSEGSYMITSDVLTPEVSAFRIAGRLWIEMRGFWDVENDYMGGPFVSFTTVDKARNRVFTLDTYVYSPKLHKRNLLRGLEHLVYLVRFPEEKQTEQQ